MERKQKMLMVTMSGIIVILATAFATADSSSATTPLYTYRMEQSSSKMNFLPSTMNTFIYTTEKGFTLNYEFQRDCADAEPLAPTWPNDPTCSPTCGGETCPNTCEESCEGTCFVETCEGTCDEETCPITCWSTCNPTCTSPYTCKHSTCAPTCNDTCTSPWTCYQSGC